VEEEGTGFCFTKKKGQQERERGRERHENRSCSVMAVNLEGILQIELCSLRAGYLILKGLTTHAFYDIAGVLAAIDSTDRDAMMGHSQRLSHCYVKGTEYVSTLYQGCTNFSPPFLNAS
jgi:hypothetical protein